MSTTTSPTRSRKPRLQDVAREAGVGIATVERVVNARGNVSNETAQRVLVAARKLGYDRAFPMPYHALVRIEVILVRPDSEFFARLNIEFQKLSQTLDPLIIVHRSFVDENDPLSIARRIREVAPARAGLVVVAQDHPAITEAVQGVRASGIPVVLLVSTLTGAAEVPYIGIDNLSAGRTAGLFMRSILGQTKGRVVTVCHSGRYGNHRQRIDGFSAYFEPPLTPACFAYCVTGGDSDEATERGLKAALTTLEDVVGIYNAGGAHRGVERALRYRRRGARIVYIGHELSPESRRLLQSDAMSLTIDQMPELQAQRAITLIERLIGLRAGEADCSPVPFRIVTKENFDG